MHKKPENGHTFIDLVIIVGKTKTFYVIMAALCFYLYVLEPGKGLYINQSVKAWIDKNTSITASTNTTPVISYGYSSSNNTNKSLNRNNLKNVYTLQIFTTHYEDTAQTIMGNLRNYKPIAWISMEEGQYHVYLGEYSSQKEASLALGQLIAEKKSDAFFQENRPFIRKLSSVTVASNSTVDRANSNSFTQSF